MYRPNRHAHGVSKEKRDFAKYLRKNPTETERILWYSLKDKKLGVRARRQVIVCGYIVDFYIPEYGLAIEIDGGYHSDALNYDWMRSRRIERTGIRVIRFSNRQVMSDVDAVVAEIKSNFF